MLQFLLLMCCVVSSFSMSVPYRFLSRFTSSYSSSTYRLRFKCRSSSRFLMSETVENLTTIAGIATAEETIKKSRFIGYAFPADTLSDGLAQLRELQNEHIKARHICWAWQGIAHENRSNDDGEPSGTGGQPILISIQSEGLSNVFVAVVRYFGGILLGTGGLVRAYGGTARACLRSASRVAIIPRSKVRIEAPISLIGSVYNAVNRFDRDSEEFTSDKIILTIEVDTSEAETVKSHVVNATRGASVVTIL